MPRIANETGALIADMQKRLHKLVEVAKHEGRSEALEEVRALVGGGAVKRAGSTAAAAKTAPRKPAKKRKNPWATMTPKQKADRVRKMLAGRGLKPKSERKPAKKAARTTRKR
jgi:hypothetical protein